MRTRLRRWARPRNSAVRPSTGTSSCTTSRPGPTAGSSSPTSPRARRGSSVTAGGAAHEPLDARRPAPVRPSDEHGAVPRARSARRGKQQPRPLPAGRPGTARQRIRAKAQPRDTDEEAPARRRHALDDGARGGARVRDLCSATIWARRGVDRRSHALTLTVYTFLKSPRVGCTRSSTTTRRGNRWVCSRDSGRRLPWSSPVSRCCSRSAARATRRFRRCRGTA